MVSGGKKIHHCFKHKKSSLLKKIGNREGVGKMHLFLKCKTLSIDRTKLVILALCFQQII